MCEFQKNRAKVGDTIEVINAMACGSGYKNGDVLFVTRVDMGGVYAATGTCGGSREHYLFNVEFKVV